MNEKGSSSKGDGSFLCLKTCSNRREAKKGCRERGSLLGFGAKPQRIPNAKHINCESGSEAIPDFAQVGFILKLRKYETCINQRRKTVSDFASRHFKYVCMVKQIFFQILSFIPQRDILTSSKRAEEGGIEWA